MCLLLAAPTEVERVMALVNGVPVLASDVQLAEVSGVVPRQPGETDTDYRRVVTEALIALELRWQDLAAAGVVQRTPIDLDAAWQGVTERAGGAAALQERLSGCGFDEALLRELLRRATVVETYVVRRFTPFVRPTREEIEATYRAEVVDPALQRGERPPELGEVRTSLELLLRERKLKVEVDRWTAELEKRAEVTRYVR